MTLKFVDSIHLFNKQKSYLQRLKIHIDIFEGQKMSKSQWKKRPDVIKKKKL